MEGFSQLFRNATILRRNDWDAMAVDLRTSQSLRLWHDVHLDLVHQGGDLSSRQIAILLTIYLNRHPTRFAVSHISSALRNR